jgi:hypothetical protein
VQLGMSALSHLMRLELAQRAFLINAHQSAVAGNITREDRSHKQKPQHEAGASRAFAL